MTNDVLLTLQVIGTDGMLLDVDGVSSINVRMENGSLVGIRPGHTPLIGLTASGVLNYKKDGVIFYESIQDGILTIDQNAVRILTTSPKAA